MKFKEALLLAKNFIKEEWPDITVTIPLVVSIANLIMLEEMILTGKPSITHEPLGDISFSGSPQKHKDTSPETKLSQISQEPLLSESSSPSEEND